MIRYLAFWGDKAQVKGKKEVLQDSPTWPETVKGFDKVEKALST
jgi:hypothetical protein